MKKKTDNKGRKLKNGKNKFSIISILFDIILRKNRDKTVKLNLINEKNKKINSKAKNIEARILKKRFEEIKDRPKTERKLRPELSLPKIRYFNLEEMPKLDYGALFSYLGNTFRAFYDKYKAFKYDGEGRIEFEHEVEQRKYERIVEKEFMAEFGFFALEHTAPEEKENYGIDRMFGFRKAIIYLTYFMKPGSLRIVPGVVSYEQYDVGAG